MNSDDNIEKLFKDTFEHFESPVKPEVWSRVQNGINAASGGAVSSSSLKFTIGKIIAATVIGGIAASVWYFSTSNPGSSVSNKQNKVETFPKNTFISPENKTAKSYTDSKIEEAPAVMESSEPKGKFQQPEVVSEITPNNLPQNTTSSQNKPFAVVSSKGEIEDKQDKNSAASNPLQENQVQNAQNLKSKDNSFDESEQQTPTAVIFASTESGDVPLTVNFSNTGFFATSTWDFGDGNTSKDNSTSHTFNKPGNYSVKLTAKNSKGSASNQIIIEVKSISGITNIPNVFSPNGDGENDLFFFELRNIVSIDVVIYSQKEGEQIHKWNSLDGNWNGKLRNGSHAPEGVYLYSIQAIGIDEVTYSKKGFVTLSR